MEIKDIIVICWEDVLGPDEIQRLIKQAHEDIPMVKGRRLKPLHDDNGRFINRKEG